MFRSRTGGEKVERDDAEFRSANERIATMAEELRKAELVRDNLEGLDRLMGSYPEGHDMRARLEDLHVDQTLEGVNEDIRVLTDPYSTPAVPEEVLPKRGSGHSSTPGQSSPCTSPTPASPGVPYPPSTLAPAPKPMCHLYPLFPPTRKARREPG